MSNHMFHSMYNALSGLGGAGQVDATVQNNSAVALHSTFAVLGFLAGIANNYLCVLSRK